MTDELRFPTELKLWKYKIERLARRFGLDFYPIMYNIVTAQEMSEVVARHGFPTTPHHWRTGQESLQWKKRFRYGMGRIYEIVLNTIPAYAFLLQLNDVITQKSVMAHVPGHVDVNKNNAYFTPTNRDMVNAFASDALRVERYFELIGRDRVKLFYDTILSFEWFIDPNSLYMRRQRPVKSVEEQERVQEERKIPKRIESRDELPAYMDEFLNPPEWIEEEKVRLEELAKIEANLERGAVIPPEPTRDIPGFLARFAPLERWQRDLIAMIRRQSYYFAPMARTKLIHEGWATLWEEEIMTEAGMIVPSELTQYAQELAGVQRQGGGINPYRLGYELWQDIRFRWDTGRHGPIWNDCQLSAVKDSWDEFAVYKTLVDEYGYASEAFNGRWAEFSAFIEELKAGRLAYPKEFFVRNLFTKEYLVPVWLKYCKAAEEHSKFSRMQLEMEPLELEAALLAGELAKDASGDAREELQLKARRDIYKRAGKTDLWLWTPDEIKRELVALDALLAFGKRWRSGVIQHAVIPIPDEWIGWAAKYPDVLRLGVGLEKIFEVRSTHDDLMFLEEFFTKEFCEDHKYFLYKAKTVWDYSRYTARKHYVIDSRSFRRIKKRLLWQYTNMHLPIICVTEANYHNNGELYLVHQHNGVDLDYWSKDGMYIKDVLARLFQLWGSSRRVHLETVVTRKEEDRPWWFDWHSTEDKVTDDEEREVTGTRTVFSFALSNGYADFRKEEKEVVTYKAPF